MPRGNKPIHGMRSGELYNGKRPRAYSAWVNLRQRCLNSRRPDFKNYGGRGQQGRRLGRGITFCREWESFEGFLADMGEPPEGMMLERINNDEDYCKANCKWATRAEQNLNKRNIKRYEFDGKSLTLGQWSKETGIGRLTLYKRLQAGKSIEQALNWKLWAKKL